MASLLNFADARCRPRSRLLLTASAVRGQPGVGFNLYRTAGSSKPARLNQGLLTKTTDYVDTAVDPSVADVYTVRAVVGGKELAASAALSPSGAPAPYTYNAVLGHGMASPPHPRIVVPKR